MHGQRLTSNLMTVRAQILRGLGVGCTALLLAVLAHIQAGGRIAINNEGIALVIATVAGSIALSRYRWTFSRLLAVMIVAQLLFHQAFSNAMDMGGPSTTSMALAHVLSALLMSAAISRADKVLYEWIDYLVARLLRVPAFAPLPVEASRPIWIRVETDVVTRFAIQEALVRGPPKF